MYQVDTAVGGLHTLSHLIFTILQVKPNDPHFTNEEREDR